MLPGHFPTFLGQSKQYPVFLLASGSAILCYSPGGVLSQSFPISHVRYDDPARFSFQSPLAKSLSPLPTSWLNWACSACAPLSFMKKPLQHITSSTGVATTKNPHPQLRCQVLSKKDSAEQKANLPWQIEFPSGQPCTFPWNSLT